MIPPHIFKELCGKKISGVMATVLSSDGQGPARPGNRLFWADGQLVFGTVGGGSNELQVLEACAALSSPKCILQINSSLPGLLPSCGGKLEIQLERVNFGNPEEATFHQNEPRPTRHGKLFLLGAGHVAREVAWLADRNGFEIFIIDPRQELMLPENFPENCTLLRNDYKEIFTAPSPDTSDFIVIAGPDHPTDLALLQQAAKTSAQYIGVMGSKKKITSFEKVLKRDNVWQSLHNRLHAPIGIPISSRSPSEVAVSIVAELIKIKAT